jgi:hypothetical protein
MSAEYVRRISCSSRFPEDCLSTLGAWDKNNNEDLAFLLSSEMPPPRN